MKEKKTTTPVQLNEPSIESDQAHKCYRHVVATIPDIEAWRHRSRKLADGFKTATDLANADVNGGRLPADAFDRARTYHDDWRHPAAATFFEQWVGLSARSIGRHFFVKRTRV